MSAPVLIFAYNRPKHLANCLESLINNSEATSTNFTVLIDGPKNSSDRKNQSQMTKYLAEIRKKVSINYVLNTNNLGLSASVIRGLDLMFKFNEEVIVVEDDLVLSKHFLKFCNDGLKKFKYVEKVGSIQGFSYNFFEMQSSPYFLRGADCWGWATWQDRWKLFEPSSEILIKIIKELNFKKNFDLNGAYPYFKMLQRESRGEVDSWAIRWHASMFINDKLSLYPNISLVRNDGFDGSGTHGNVSKKMNVKFPSEPIEIGDIPISESAMALKQLELFLRERYSTFPNYSIRRFTQIVKRFRN